MSGELRTTTLTFGPFDKPLSAEHVALLAHAAARAIGQGFTVMRSETEHTIAVHAFITAPIAHPFTRVRELVPGAVVTALAGEATASHQD